MAAALVIAITLLLSGCGGPKHARVTVPPPPPIAQPDTQSATGAADSSAGEPADQEDNEAEDAKLLPADGKPLFTETGLASWYGAPYHNRKGSNGEVYNMHALTAAHRTLPLGTVVRVTNVKTGHSAIVRITDRGPFVDGRILDLSQAAAKKVDVIQPGVARVRVDVLKTPSSLDGGRWAVQIGAFEEEQAAKEFKDHLSRRYHTAKVQSFGSPVGDWWVRVRVLNDDRKRAEEVASDTQTSEGSIFLVRLD